MPIPTPGLSNSRKFWDSVYYIEILKTEEAELAGFLLLKGLKVLIDNCDCEQDPGTRADRSHEIRQHGQGADAHSAECCSRGDVAVELLVQVGISVTGHHHLLFLQGLQQERVSEI